MLALIFAVAMQTALGRVVVRTVNVDDGGHETELPGVTVTIAGPVTRSSSTDAGGTAHFAGLPRGIYSVRGDLSGFERDQMDVCVDNAEVRATLLLPTLPPHIGTVVVGVPAADGEMTGVIAGEDDSPLRRAVVQVMDDSNGRLLGSTRSNRHGAFKLLHVPFSTHRQTCVLRITHAGRIARQVIVNRYGVRQHVGTIHLMPVCFAPDDRGDWPLRNQRPAP